MAFRLEKQKTGSTPYILIDEGKSYMRFQGESFHENVAAFFSEVDEWLRAYLKTDFKKLTFDCELEYINSSTAKLLLNMLIEMDEHASSTNAITINWITSEDNEIMIECGEDFQLEVSNLTFNMQIK